MNSVFTKNIVEFVTVGVEYCGFLEHIEEKNQAVVLSVMQKLLPLLYLKAAMVEKPVPICEDDIETFVTELDYETIRGGISRLMERYDAFFDGEEACSISESLTDIYQDMKDFVMNYKEGNPAVSIDALYHCMEHFESFWGQRLIAVMRHLHYLMYGGIAVEEEYEESATCKSDAACCCGSIHEHSGD